MYAVFLTIWENSMWSWCIDLNFSVSISVFLAIVLFSYDSYSHVYMINSPVKSLFFLASRIFGFIYGCVLWWSFYNFMVFADTDYDLNKYYVFPTSI